MTKILNCLWHRVEAMIFVTSYNAYYELKTACACRVWLNSSFIKCILTDTGFMFSAQCLNNITAATVILKKYLSMYDKREYRQAESGIAANYYNNIQSEKNIISFIDVNEV